jgi:hypothetical protein
MGTIRDACVVASAPMDIRLIPPAVATMLVLTSSAVAAAHQPPSKGRFAHIFIASTNAYAVAHHDARRVLHADCVEPTAGRYMCSFLADVPPGRHECHLIQAKWTPGGTSTITITLSGRTRRCGSLQEALRSLSS